jgi:S1-C subfamily serine protease
VAGISGQWQRVFISDTGYILTNNRVEGTKQ